MTVGAKKKKKSSRKPEAASGRCKHAAGESRRFYGRTRISGPGRTARSVKATRFCAPARTACANVLAGAVLARASLRRHFAAKRFKRLNVYETLLCHEAGTHLQSGCRTGE